MLAAGCGSSPSSDSVAHLGASKPTTTTPGAASAVTAPGSAGDAAALAYSQCMRKNGVPNFPDPGVQGGFSINSKSGINPNSSQFQHAQTVCQKKLPGGGPNPAQQAQHLAQALKFSECMRKNGVTDFPDPVAVGNGGIGIRINAKSGINPNSAQFQAATTKCQAILPGAGPHPGPAGGGPVVHKQG